MLRDAVAEQGQDVGLTQGRGGQDARARRAALHLAHGQPFLAGEGR